MFRALDERDIVVDTRWLHRCRSASDLAPFIDCAWLSVAGGLWGAVSFVSGLIAPRLRSRFFTRARRLNRVLISQLRLGNRPVVQQRALDVLRGLTPRYSMTCCVTLRHVLDGVKARIARESAMSSGGLRHRGTGGPRPPRRGSPRPLCRGRQSCAPPAGRARTRGH